MLYCYQVLTGAGQVRGSENSRNIRGKEELYEF